MGFVCLICGALNANVLEINLYSSEKSMAIQITMLINNSTVNSIGVFGVEEDYRTKDVLEGILSNLSFKPSIFLGQKQQTKMDILFYFIRNIDKVSHHEFP